MKLIFTLRVVASSSAPFFTACQNWCWNPLETIGMYGAVSKLGSGERLEAGAAGDWATAGAAASATATEAISTAMRLRSLLIYPPGR